MPIRARADRRGYVYAGLRGLLTEGWVLKAVPSGGRLRLNQQLLTLHYLGTTKRYRLLIFKVSRSGRNRPNERRIEATSTYVGGRVVPVGGVEDVLLGYDEDHRVFVGFDPRRLHYGGSTQNASSFFDVAELERATDTGVHVVPRASELFDVEYHAFVHPRRLAEYLVNMTLIHTGSYAGGGQFSKRERGRTITPARESVADDSTTGTELSLEAPGSMVRPTGPPRGGFRASDLETVETVGVGALRRRRIRPEELDEILRQARTNGLLGEHHVLEEERRRLRMSGRPELAAQVAWVSQDDVGAGYDIRSFDTDGQPRLIEVKSTSGEIKRFIISRNEWRVAGRHGPSYWIYLVTCVTTSPMIHRYQDPVELMRAGVLVWEELDWIVSVP